MSPNIKVSATLPIVAHPKLAAAVDKYQKTADARSGLNDIFKHAWHDCSVVPTLCIRCPQNSHQLLMLLLQRTPMIVLHVLPGMQVEVNPLPPNFGKRSTSSTRSSGGAGGAAAVPYASRKRKAMDEEDEEAVLTAFVSVPVHAQREGRAARAAKRSAVHRPLTSADIIMPAAAVQVRFTGV